jgi:DNA-binding MarR family transcriptional regulator
MSSKSEPGYLPSVGRLLGFATRRTNAIAERRLAEHGLRLQHWVVLTALWRRDGMTITELGRYYAANIPALSRTLDRMRKEGWIERRRNAEDRRVVRIFLTRKARNLSHLIDFYREINGVLLKGFTKQERATLFAMLERIIANGDKALPEG